MTTNTLHRGITRRQFMVGAAGLTFTVLIDANAAVEMGQGSQTAIPLIIAEEMDADWPRVRIVPAAPDDKVYGNPGFRGLMYTAGSATVTGYWDVARTFGAQVRRVMMDNAARL